MQSILKRRLPGFKQPALLEKEFLIIVGVAEHAL